MNEKDTLIDQAVRLGLERSLASKKSLGWLRLFIETQINIQSNYDNERGRANAHTAHEQLKHWK